MVFADGRHHADLCVDDVGRVQPTAEANLEDGGIDRLVGEECEGGGGRELEVGVGSVPRPLAKIGERSNVAHGDSEFLTRRETTVDGEPLLHALQVRRSVRACREAMGDQDQGGKPRRRSLAIGSGHVNDRIPLLGPTH